MRVDYITADLIAFEQEMAGLFLKKKIRAPIHLSGGNEEQLIGVFRNHVQPDDWICCTWRSHYHCLLKGVPSEVVRASILAGHSIALCFPSYRVISSAIVGGMAPIAVGLALGIKRNREDKQRRVFCFVGDMAWETGIVQESVKYAYNFSLPVTWVVEDNGLSTNTDTKKAWGIDQPGRNVTYWATLNPSGSGTIRYNYVNQWPHCGVGQHVDFGAERRTDGMG